jgi:hypothetical protein
MKSLVQVKPHKKEKVVVLSDWHVPHHSSEVIELELVFCKEQQPDIVVFHELHDFYAISKYDKDPKRTEDLQLEIDIVNRYMQRFREACPKTRFILLNSNHLDRLRRYLWNVAPGLNSLRALEIEQLLELKKYKIEFMETFTHKNFLFKHGNVVRRYSSYSAKGEFEKEGMSGCSGHTHRLGMYFHRVRGGEYVWMESGCGCELDPEYISGISNWQHGFLVIEFEREGNYFYPHLVPIVHNKFMWGEKMYSI